MRIPAEVVPLVANLGKDSDEVSKPEPVGSVAAIGTELSATLPDLQPADRRQRQQRDGPATEEAPAQDATPPVERRQKERRTEQRPVLLDTRSRSGRRKAGGDVTVNIKV